MACVFCLHLAAADWYGRIVQEISSGHAIRRTEKVPLLLVTSLLVTFTVGFFAVGIYRYRPGRECTYSKYLFLKDYVTRGEVVLTDPSTSLFVPSIAGKLVATLYPQTFVEDHQERRRDVGRFLDPATENKDRQLVLEKYNVDFILLNKQLVTSSHTKDEIKKLGLTVFSNDDLLLVSVKI